MIQDCYKTFLRPLLFKMDPEEAHNFIHAAARNLAFTAPLWARTFQYSNTDLACEIFGTKLANPVGLAAGFDKNGNLVDLLGHLGFGFAEVGSITAQASNGNPKPRLFRLEEDKAIINRMGLNGHGADSVSAALHKAKFSLPVGINIAKTNDPSIQGDRAVEDILYTFKQIKDLPVTHVTINGSCPNTKEGVVTESAFMHTVFSEIQKLNSLNLPILTKLSPDSPIDLLEQMSEVARNCNLAGYVCGNTSTKRDNLKTSPSRIEAIANGGLSGVPIRSKALQLVQNIYKLKSPTQIIIGCGGVSSGADAYALITAGASLIQVYTGLIYEGPQLPQIICSDLSRILAREGLTLRQAIGANHQSPALSRG